MLDFLMSLCWLLGWLTVQLVGWRSLSTNNQPPACQLPLDKLLLCNADRSTLLQPTSWLSIPTPSSVRCWLAGVVGCWLAVNRLVGWLVGWLLAIGYLLADCWLWVLLARLECWLGWGVGLVGCCAMDCSVRPPPSGRTEYQI